LFGIITILNRITPGILEQFLHWYAAGDAGKIQDEKSFKAGTIQVAIFSSSKLLK